MLGALDLYPVAFQVKICAIISGSLLIFLFEKIGK
jgi:hypothetical protein